MSNILLSCRNLAKSFSQIDAAPHSAAAPGGLSPDADVRYGLADSGLCTNADRRAETRHPNQPDRGSF